MSYWLRLYTDILDNRKVQRLDAELFKTWINLLCLAKEHGGILPEISDIAFRLRIEDGKAEEQIAALINSNLLERDGDQIKPHNWEGRQYVSDISTKRVQEFRKRQRNVSPTAPGTAGNVSETVPEQKQSRNRGRAEREAEQQQSGGDFAAAAKNGHELYAGEAHASRFGFLEIQRYVEATKRHATNSGGLARTLFRSGEEDHLIARWLESQRWRESMRRGALVGPNDDFGPVPAPREGKWGQVLDALESLIGAEPVSTWFEPLRFEPETQTLIAPDPVFVEWVQSNYLDALDQALKAAGLASVRLQGETCESMKCAQSVAARSVEEH